MLKNNRPIRIGSAKLGWFILDSGPGPMEEGIMPWSFWRLLALAGLALLVLIAAGIVLSRVPVLVEIKGGSVALVTVTPTATATAAPASAPRQDPPPSPAPLREPQPAFVQALLATIASRPPDYEDKFDDLASGWESALRDVRVTGWEGGLTEYAGGEYAVVADPAHFPQGAGRVTCNSGGSRSLPEFADFVLQVDGRFVSGRSGTWQLQWRLRNDLAAARSGGYALAVGSDRDMALLRFDNQETTSLATARPPTLRAGIATIHLQIVAQDDQYAVFVNDELALTGTIPDGRKPPGGGGIRFVVCNSGDVPLRAQWDNLRIWDLTRLGHK